MFSDPDRILQRLHARSYVDGECLVWGGARNKGGYGVITIGGQMGKRMLVHRTAWIVRHGTPPNDTPFVLHECDNPPCWLEDHLFLGTPKSNMEDMSRKGRARDWQYRCEDAPGAKLTNAQVAVIKQRLVAGETQAAIAADYGVTKVAVGHIWRGRNFIEVPWPASYSRS